jgi:DNA-binding NtrC family response regulator
MWRPLIYLIDDDDVLRKAFRKTLKRFYEVREFAARNEALAATESERPDLVLLGIKAGDEDGLEFIRRLRHLCPQTLLIALTVSEDVQTVISAMRLGAHDCLLKPVYAESVLARVQDALETIRLRKQVHALQEKSIRDNLPCILGESHAIQEVMEIVNRIAQSSDTPVLIIGETGTGKELIAGAIHYRSPNFNGPFLPVNCAAIPANLVESEFFGYEPGAFSGAQPKGKKGLVEKAGNGTLFLDEVGDLGPEAQAKLLRFLESGEFYRVGGTEKLRVQTRIISASNRNPEELVAEGRFRDDLYYRLGVIRIEVPTLNERREDILLLANYFVAQFCEKFKKPMMGLCNQAETALKERHWQGNIRELRNVIERAVLLTNGDELTLDDLGVHPSLKVIAPGPASSTKDAGELPVAGVDLSSILNSVERNYIAAALDRAKGNECRAARLLKMNYNTFRYRKKRLEFE